MIKSICTKSLSSFLILSFVLSASSQANYQKLATNAQHASITNSQTHKHDNNTTGDYKIVVASSTNTSSKAGDIFFTRDWLLGADEDIVTSEAKHLSSFSDFSDRSPSSPINRNSTTNNIKAKHRKSQTKQTKTNSTLTNKQQQVYDEDQLEAANVNGIFDESEEGEGGTAGSKKEPECATKGRYYCTYKEDYPLKLVTEVTKYYKWPLEKLFRDLHAQIMPKLAQDSTGNLVCDSITRVIRPGWARNTNDRWLVVINTENYHQYITEVVCQYGTNSRCNFIPPCYYSSCQQRYNTQKLLVIDPNNPYRGPFLSEFLFPSCCVCYVPSVSESFHDKYRSSPTTIFQRTIQQEAASNLYPPQYQKIPEHYGEDIQQPVASLTGTSLTSAQAERGEFESKNETN